MQTLKPIILFLSIDWLHHYFQQPMPKPVRILVRIKKHRHGMKNVKNQVKQDGKVWIVMVDGYACDCLPGGNGKKCPKKKK